MRDWITAGLTLTDDPVDDTWTSMEILTQEQQLIGLSQREAGDRLQQEGYNELPSTQHRSFLAIAWDIVQEPIFLLLLGCGLIYLFLGDAQEALILLGFVVFIVGINLYQEQKTERSLEALRDLSSPRALVIRDGARQRIARREVVRGDEPVFPWAAKISSRVGF